MLTRKFIILIDRPSPPGKPFLVSEIDFTPDVVTIRWEKPISDGGSPITGYLVEHRRTGSPHWVRATPLMVPFPELSISGLEPGWRYQFRVRAENAVGLSDTGDLSEPLTLTLQRSAITAPRFTQELVDTTALENEKVEFVVHFLGQPAPKVCWFKDGFEIFSSRRTRILTEADRSMLTIHQSALADEGEIKCTATNRAGHASTKSKLTLEAPPSIRLPRQYEEGLLFEIGEQMRLKVSVAGRPTPLIFWHHNGDSIQDGERFEIKYSDRSSILKIDEAKRSDRGEYQIRAVNKLGEDSASFLVTVTDKPSPPGRARVVMTLGRSVTLSWKSPNDDGGCKIGNYIIEYYRLGWNVWLKAATSRQLTTILGDLIEGSEYKFRIKAESPYGVSEPSEESDIIFIPDVKRGITSPEIRSRSQPRDIIDEVAPPIAIRRHKKAEPRSHSSSRAEESTVATNINSNIFNAGIPKRPQRTKTKSQPQTPEASPLPIRRDNSPINKAIFDRASMAREMAYGSPQIQVKKTELILPQKDYLNNYSSGSDRSDRSDKSDKSDTSVPSLNLSSIAITGPINVMPDLDFHQNKIQIQERQITKTPSPVRQKSPSPSRVIVNSNTPKMPSPKLNQKLSRENSENAGSSEFMLVLYPDENEKEKKEQTQNRFEFDDNPPPPISLSAPELGAEPQFEILRYCGSSSELLHERAMMRFYEAAQEEEAEAENRKQQTRSRKTSIPKIQINSKDDQYIVGLERSNSSQKRRMSAGLVSHSTQQWAQRRHSLRGPNDIMEVVEKKLQKYPVTIEDKRELMMLRQRSESEEREEEEFEKLRTKLTNKPSTEKRKITVLAEEIWNEEDFEESLSEDDDDEEEESEASEDEREIRRTITPKPIIYSDEEEQETYSGFMGRQVLNSSKNEEPFEILTKRKEPPDPNFVPKPILKKVDIETNNVEPKEKKKNIMSKIRSRSPMPNSRQRSGSLITTEQIENKRERSYSLADAFSFKEPILEEPKKRKFSLKSEDKIKTDPTKRVSAIAQLSGITAASIVIPENLLQRKKAEEEAKVVADHYGDIVRSFGQRKRSIPQVYLDRDELKKASTSNEPSLDQIQNTKVIPNKPTNKNEETYADQYASTSNSNTQLNQSTVANKKFNHEGRRENPTEMSPNQNRKKRSDSRSPSRSSSSRRSSRSSNRRSQSKSPHRLENWSGSRPNPNKKIPKKKSPSPMRTKSPSPQPTQFIRKPKLREIMTQTSVGLESFSSDSRTDSPSGLSLRQEELMAKAEVKVRTVVDYLTDLAMFVVACWLYLFSNELLAIPVLIIMVYRQLEQEIRKRIPKWILKRLKKKKK